MNEQEQQLYPELFLILQLSRRCGSIGFRETFPNTIFSYGGAETLGSCIGFVRGLLGAGMDIEKVSKIARSLIHCLRYGMVDKKWGGDDSVIPWDRPHETKLLLAGTSSFLGFGFARYHLLEDQINPNCEYVEFIGNSYQDSQRERKWKYAKGTWGGIDFHGLDPVFSVSITDGLGWQMHT